MDRLPAALERDCRILGGPFILKHILFFLLPDLCRYGCLIQDCIHAVSGRLTVPVTEPVLPFSVFLKDHRRRFSLEIPHETGDAILRRYRQQQMYMMGILCPSNISAPFHLHKAPIYCCISARSWL